MARAPGWIVKTGKSEKSGSVSSIKWSPHSAVFALRQAAEDYAALVRKLEPHHEVVAVFPIEGRA